MLSERALLYIGMPETGLSDRGIKPYYKATREPCQLPSEDDLGLGFWSEASAAEKVGLTSLATITTQESNAPSFYDSDTSADELSVDHGPSDKRSKRPGKRLLTRHGLLLISELTVDLSQMESMIEQPNLNKTTSLSAPLECIARAMGNISFLFEIF